MTKTTAAAGAVMAISGVGTLVAAFATVGGWSTSPWIERLLLVCIVLFLATAWWIVIAFAIAASLRALAFFVAPEQPPGLIRVNMILEQQRAEREAAPNRIPADSAPQTVAQQREIGHL